MAKSNIPGGTPPVVVVVPHLPNMTLLLLNGSSRLSILPFIVASAMQPWKGALDPTLPPTRYPGCTPPTNNTPSKMCSGAGAVSVL